MAFTRCAFWCVVGLAALACATTGRAQKAVAWRPVVFFPPVPPVYGATIPNAPTNRPIFYRGRRLEASEELAYWVSESFYPVLSTRLFTEPLGRGLARRLEEYRVARRAEVNALLDRLILLHQASAEDRLVSLRALAREQEPRLLALEEQAEALRLALLNDWRWGDLNWNAQRRWDAGRMMARTDWVAKEAEFQIVRAAAFYQEGLLTQQRGLLREIAMELQPLARRAAGLPVSTDESDAMFFLPETARMRLPKDLPSGVREKIAAFNAEKTALKRELREAVRRTAGRTAEERARDFQALADAQWLRLRALEEQAEEIRLAINPPVEVAPPPPPPWLPAGLLEAIESYNEDRAAYYAEADRLAAEAMALVPPVDPNTPPDERAQRMSEYVVQRQEARRRAMQDFQAQNQERFAELHLRMTSIRQMLAIVAEKQIDRQTGRPLDADTLLRKYAAAMRAFDAFGRESAIYTHYRVAMLQPGLSAAQRRLLFGYALAGLAQPLPFGEPMPRGNRPFRSW